MSGLLNGLSHSRSEPLILWVTALYRHPCLHSKCFNLAKQPHLFLTALHSLMLTRMSPALLYKHVFLLSPQPFCQMRLGINYTNEVSSSTKTKNACLMSDLHAFPADWFWRPLIVGVLAASPEVSADAPRARTSLPVCTDVLQWLWWLSPCPLFQFSGEFFCSVGVRMPRTVYISIEGSECKWSSANVRCAGWGLKGAVRQSIILLVACMVGWARGGDLNSPAAASQLLVPALWGQRGIVVVTSTTPDSWATTVSVYSCTEPFPTFLIVAEVTAPPHPQ